MTKSHLTLAFINLALSACATTILGGCAKHGEPAEGSQPLEVTVMVVTPRNTPVTFEYVGQTQSSHQVQIVARVNGFLEKRVYVEGSIVKAGQVMFLQDRKPFKAALDAYQGALAEQQAHLKVANDNLAQVQPLVALNALSQKDLSDATGQQQSAAAGVLTATANVEQAQFNLGYTTITTPITGHSSYTRAQDGQYLSGQSTLLTYVDQIDPIWVNFSLSENDMLNFRTQQVSGHLSDTKSDDLAIEVVLANGAIYPHKGRITFTNTDYNQQTGTFLLRATLPNPDGVLRPGQFVRTRVSGASRPDAILIPQKAVLQGAQGHFVIIVDKEGKAQIRPVELGPWEGDDWFITHGLSPGETVVTDGVIKLAPGAPVKIVATAGAATGTAATAPAAAR
jgi:membrane fusion protein, multidrug efflux system